MSVFSLVYWVFKIGRKGRKNITHPQPKICPYGIGCHGGVALHGPVEWKGPEGDKFTLSVPQGKGERGRWIRWEGRVKTPEAFERVPRDILSHEGS